MSMPSIEVICIGQKTPTRFKLLPFVLKTGTKLQSHRIPSHFQVDFDQMKGCIYHFAGPSYRHRKLGAFEGYELLSGPCRRQETSVFLQFDRRYAKVVKSILNRLMEKSPYSELVFTSDYQFSPNKAKRVRGLALSDFWRIHNARKVKFNSLYVISRAPTA
jgi:hypothetical protein